MSNALHPTIGESWVPDDTFGARLAQIRQHFGWNVKEAAFACGIKVQSWRNWENGRLPRDYEAACNTIATHTGCDLDWLLRGWTSRSRCFSEKSCVAGDQPHDVKVRPSHLTLVQS